MTTGIKISRIGGALVLFGALAVVPFSAGAAMANNDANPRVPVPNTQTEALAQPSPSHDGQVLVARVGYINLPNTAHGRSHAWASDPMNETSAHNASSVLVPKVGYVNVQMPS